VRAGTTTRTVPFGGVRSFLPESRGVGARTHRRLRLPCARGGRAGRPAVFRPRRGWCGTSIGGVAPSRLRCGLDRRGPVDPAGAWGEDRSGEPLGVRTGRPSWVAPSLKAAREVDHDARISMSRSVRSPPPPPAHVGGDGVRRHAPQIRASEIGPVTDRLRLARERGRRCRPAPGRTAPAVARPLGPDDQ
jgi:hypothetical protein